MTTDKILIVDDEPTILAIYEHQLADEFQIDTAPSGEDALALLAAQGPYAVIVADMHMPGMSGTELLQRAQESYPQSVRITLTADDQQAVAVRAVNEGRIFRFLNKPCPADQLAKTLRAGLEQYRIVMAEKELLANTLTGSIALMVELLARVSPLAFGRATRIKSLVLELCNRTGNENSWEVALAAMLSQVGCIALPDCILEKIQRPERLTPVEHRLFQSHPQLGCDLISKIPRLERIGKIIALQQRPHGGEGSEVDQGGPVDILRHAGFLKVALDYDALLQQGFRAAAAVRKLFEQSQAYEPPILQALAELVHAEQRPQVCEMSLNELSIGMVVAENIVDSIGILLIPKGHEVTEWVLKQLRGQRALGRAVREPIRVQSFGSLASDGDLLSPLPSRAFSRDYWGSGRVRT